MNYSQTSGGMTMEEKEMSPCTFTVNSGNDRAVS